jgi:phosphoenolpyruvate carboxykinase (GTP)
MESMDRDEGLKDVHDILKNIMTGHDMYVVFVCLGPVNSPFSISCVQLTDSAYVVHNEILLYRPGYEQFKRLGNSPDFFKFVHSQGELVEGVCKNIEQRRIYIDLVGNTVYSTNTQYGGNTIGPKKLAMRLAIQKASKEGWLCEHMFLMGVAGPKGRRTYFAGAYPSMCGKTSTAMVPGETIVGDDIAYLRIIGGRIKAVNVEEGMFGIIQDVNAKGDPTIYKALTSPGEVIFSNVLDADGVPRWLGDGREPPKRGVNHGGEWYPGKKDANGKEIDMSHKNARYTISITTLENCDGRLDDAEGIELGGIIYGGRDSDTSVPVEQSFDWVHGIVTKGATLESETTAATLGKEGVREFNPMSNLDFLSIPIGRYIQDNLNLGSRVKKPPMIFGVNYFLRDKNGKYLNTVRDKRVWLKWMERRVNGEAGAIKTPTGYIPKYEDLRKLFKEVLGREYSKAEYDTQFTIRVLELMAKVDRIEVIYREKVPDTPDIVFKALDEQRKRLENVKGIYGDYIKPEHLRE